MTLRIAYMTGEYPRATDTFIQREVAALRRLGVHVETFSIRQPRTRAHVDVDQQLEFERTFYVLPCRVGQLISSHLQLIVAHPLRYLLAIKLALSTGAPGIRARLYQLFYFVEAGIVACELDRRELMHLHNHFANSSCSVAMLAAALAGVPYSITMHGPAIFFEPRRWRIDRKIERAAFVSCISHFCRSQAMIFCSPNCWNKLHLVHCGVEPALFARRRHAAGSARLLFVGRLAAVKGLPMLLQAVSFLAQDWPDLRLTLVGDGPDRSWLQEQITSLGIEQHVALVGAQSPEQVRQRLEETDVLVMSSFAEGVPVVLMEAMAAHVPVIAPRLAGIPELVEDNASGLLYPPGDVNSLTQCISTLLNSSELRQQMGAAGRQHVEQEFDVDREARRLLQLFKRALEGKPTPLRPPVIWPADASTVA